MSVSSYLEKIRIFVVCTAMPIEMSYRRAICSFSEQYCYTSVQNVNWQTTPQLVDSKERSRASCGIPGRGFWSACGQAAEPSVDDLILLRVSISCLRCSRLRP